MLTSVEATVEEIKRLITSDVIKTFVSGIETSTSMDDLVGHSKAMFN
jgi:hypothetical protein